MYMNKEIRNGWIDIISKMYKDLHNSKRVMHVSKNSDKKRERILNYFYRLEEIHNMVSESKNKSDEKLLKSFYYDLYVIKPENIPESYFQNQVKLARERGYGNIELTNEDRRRMADEVIEDQKRSLDKWIEYFLYDEESKAYAIWEKYWVFQGLQSLGKYDKKTLKFSKRDETTVYPFPPVEREYIFTTLRLMEDYIKDKKGDEEIKSALSSGNFKLLYEYVIRQNLLKGENQSNTTIGKWIKYEQGSDYNILRNSLQGYYTGWCTAAGENFAKSQLAGGDFYVYYTLDNNGEAKVPRIAIRMDGKNKIGEIRGIANNQNMEPEMLPILEEKLKEFPDRDRYFKKEHDMKLLTLIDKKVNKNIELTLEELKFLYEIDATIDGFGQEADPRIEEIKKKRNTKEDYISIFDISEEEIATSMEEWKRHPEVIKIFIGDLELQSLTSADGIILPQVIVGSLFLDRLTSTEHLILPQYVRDNLYLSRLTDCKGLTLPKHIGKDLNLANLTNADGLNFPENIGGSLYLNNLTNASNVVLPQSIGSDLELSSLISIDGIKLSKYIGGDLMLNKLASVKGLVLPQNIGGSLYLSGLNNTEGLVLPNIINYSLDLSGLSTADGLVLPQSVGGSLFLDGLSNASGLVLPNNIGADLYLNGLIYAEGLILSQTLNGGLFLSGLISANKLTLPQTINSDLDLSGLSSANGLVLPQNIGGMLNLEGLTSADDLLLPYGFDLRRLICSDDIINEILKNPDKYFRKSLGEDNNIVTHIKR